MDELVQQRRNLEIHILRTQNWCENQGSWRVGVYEAEVSMIVWSISEMVLNVGVILWNVSVTVWNIGVELFYDHKWSCIKHASKKHQVVSFVWSNQEIKTYSTFLSKYSVSWKSFDSSIWKHTCKKEYVEKHAQKVYMNKTKLSIYKNYIL